MTSGNATGRWARALEWTRSTWAALRNTRQPAVAADNADALTGLPLRPAFVQQLQQAIEMAESTHGTLAVVVLDIDNFRHINHVLGNAQGDRVLALCAQKLRALLRSGDTLARLEGDRFAAWLTGADLAQAETRVQQISQHFEQPLPLDDHVLDIRLHIGVALCPAHAGDPDTLLSRAETALRHAQLQHEAWQVYDLAQDAASAMNLSLLGELRQAIVNNELRLYLQPKVNIATGAVSGAEALVRWQHPERGLVQPTEFIPLLEQTRLIRQLTLWVFEQAAAEQVALAILGVRRVSVNLSARDLLDQSLPDKLDLILRRHRALAEGFCLEISERALMSDPLRIEAMLGRLAERGFTLAMDDFGTGRSGLGNLQGLSLHELKIDHSFVMAMAQDPRAARIVHAAIDLGHRLGLSVVAEGVANAAVLGLLQELRCDEGQGFHMSPPMPVAEFQDWLACWQTQTPAVNSAVAAHQQGLALLH
jgi:diguanylate cyclase (GGDEF)-like protein